MDQYYKETRSPSIRRKDLKARTEDEIARLTNYEKTGLGGGEFSRRLKRLEGKHAIRQESRGPKHTEIVINIKAVKGLLIQQKVHHPAGNTQQLSLRPGDEDAELDFWSSYIEEQVGKILDTKISELVGSNDLPFDPKNKKGKRHHEIIKKTAAEIIASVESRLYEFYCTRENIEKPLENKPVLTAIAAAANAIAAENLHQPFTLTVVYRGLPKDDKLDQVHGVAALNIIAKHFRVWAHDTLGINVAEKDLMILTDGKTVRTTQKIQPYSDEFYDLVKKYTQVLTRELRQKGI